MVGVLAAEIMNQIPLSMTPEPVANPADGTLIDLFTARVAASPNQIAAIFEDQSLTYGDMGQRVDALARGLTAKGIGAKQIVGLWMDRGLDLQLALLAILRVGAAYLPFDRSAPWDRVKTCLTDAGATGLLVDAGTAVLADGFACTLLTLASLSRSDGANLPDPRDLGVTPDDPAYLIYTSGSTGTPKGVAISHRNICHYLHAAQTVYRLVPDDVMFQAASVAFDLSLEEIFLPYLVGARLWIASQDCLQETDRLGERMAAAGITVLDTVPTLLALLPDDVPSLRVVILGGEACPPALAAKWCRPGRVLFNSYGPTETTVVATAIELQAGDPITIGRPLPGYRCYVVDHQMALAQTGEEGELLIGGPGVAAGYWRRPDLTAAKFIANPFSDDPLEPVLYRTGDAVSWDAEGRLVFHGRIDDQVKIRGFRVELGEIEAKLGVQPGVSQAAVCLRRDNDIERLAAFVTLAPGCSEAPDAWRKALAALLPPYMVPSHFQAVERLPLLSSGKLNRNSLRDIPLVDPKAGDSDEAPGNAIEAILLAALKPLLPGQPIHFDADFFLDLGGHSLIAARFVSSVRKYPALAGLTIHDVYAARSLRAMASLLGAKQAERVVVQPFTPPPLLRRFLCGVAQAACLPLILALTTAPWLGVFVVYQLFTGEDHDPLREMWMLMLTYAGVNFSSAMLAILGKWLVLGRTRPGSYPLWGVYYFRWWVARQLITMIHLNWFKTTPLMRVLLRALGARIGRDTVIGDFEAGAIDLLEIGAHATIGSRTLFANAQVIGDRLIIGRVTVGDFAAIDSSCVLGSDCVIGEGTELADLTAVAAGRQLGAWEMWEGSPARQVGHVDRDKLPPLATASVARRVSHFCFYSVMLGILPSVTLIPIIPAFYIIDVLSDWLSDRLPISDLLILPILAWPAAMALIFLTVLLITAIRWTVLPVVKAGRYSVHSGFFLRKWVVALITELTLETMSSLFATVYMRNWYRLLGAKIGRDAEISTDLGGLYDLIDIGEKCFIADQVVLGNEDIRRGWMTLRPIRTAERVFVGNSAVIPPGSDIPKNTLIGIKSRPPFDHRLMQEGGVWFGSPPILLPVRQRFDQIASHWTYDPSRARRFGRAVFEAFSTSLPSMLAITVGSAAVDFLAPAIFDHNYAHLIPLFVLCSSGISVILMLAALAIKWLAMGVYRPTIKPMWSWWALRTEAVTGNYFGLAGDLMMDHLRGTPFLPWALRLFGCKFGQGVYMDSTDITEFDCVSVGDFAAVNSAAVLQTHLYEDRVMKFGRVSIGKGVSIDGGTTVLYDTKVGDYARIGPLTIVMKGEEIPAQSYWQGAPAQPVVSAP